LAGLGVQVKSHVVQMHVGTWCELGCRVVASDPHQGHLEQPGL